jgi:hypothetical protein
MTLQASGRIDMSDINVELTNSATARVALGDQTVRDLLGAPTGRIALSNAYGKIKFTLPAGGTGGEWVATSDVSWGSFMNQYAIWNQNTTVPTVESFESPVYFPTNGTYTIEYAADTLIGYAFDSGYTSYSVAQSTGAGASTSRAVTQSFTSGYHTIYVTVTNTGSAPPNPWGIAITIKDPSNNIIWTTRNTNFQNGSFDTGSLVQHGSYATFNTEWTIQLSGVNLNGVDTILGFPTPLDTTFPWPSMSGEKDVHNTALYLQYGSYTVSLSADVPSGFPAGTHSLLLNTGIPRVASGVNPGEMWFNPAGAYGTTRGPYLVSDQYVTIGANKNVKFWYKALGLADAYDVHAYIVEIYTGNKITILDQSGQTPTSGTTWQQVTTLVPTAGIYKFAFVNGSWDATGGQLTGASLYITGITVEQ